MTITVKVSDSARPQPNSIEEEISIYFVDDSANELLSVITYNIKVDKKAVLGKATKILGWPTPLAVLDTFQDFTYLVQLLHIFNTLFLGTMVGNLNALVSSRRDKFIYNFQKVAPGKFPFYINSATGEIFVISQLNETNQVWSKLGFLKGY